MLRRSKCFLRDLFPFEADFFFGEFFFLLDLEAGFVVPFSSPLFAVVASVLLTVPESLDSGVSVLSSKSYQSKRQILRDGNTCRPFVPNACQTSVGTIYQTDC